MHCITSIANYGGGELEREARLVHTHAYDAIRLWLSEFLEIRGMYQWTFDADRFGGGELVITGAEATRIPSTAFGYYL